jgi:KUP system potassium uptake protein
LAFFSDPQQGANGHGHSHGKRRALGLTLGALGVVYGDIGTSPLYALRECVTGPHGVAPTPENVFGLLSLFFWSLVLIVSAKYLIFLLAADNKGEGGVLALLTLISPVDAKGDRSGSVRSRIAILLGLSGAALLFGDGMVTPAISVLSAVEGIGSPTGGGNGFVVPVTCAILIGLFMFQRKGTAAVAAWFGPIMLLWFSAIAIAAMPWIVRHPEVLSALNPWWGIRFFMNHGWHGFGLLGAVVLCVTGSEAVYADLGHFGRGPIRRAWFFLVFPALVINYLGQGALLLHDPKFSTDPFYGLVSKDWRWFLVILATAAAVVASQALISGVFSLARQASQMGYLPRLTIRHTAENMEGQIYIPEINSVLMIACVALVLEFKHSSNLASAYGMAVTATMLITTLLYYKAARKLFGWGAVPAVALVLVFLFIDVSFFAANFPKIKDGGWFPLVVAAAAMALMTTWHRGRVLLNERVNDSTLPLQMFIDDVVKSKVHRVKGTAVFLTTLRRGTPNALLHHFKHNKVLHDRVVIMTVVTDDVPRVPPEERVNIKSFGAQFFGVVAHYGFMETPTVADVLARLPEELTIRIDTATFFLGRETLVRGMPPVLSNWRFRLFRFLSRNASSPVEFFGLPANRVVEIGTQFTL